MVVKKKTGIKSKTKKSKSKTKKSKNDKTETFSGIVIVDDDLTVNKEAELEERKAFLEEPDHTYH